MSMESEDRSLKFIMFISFLGLIDALYLSYLHHLISQGAGCPTENLPGLDCGVVLASEQAKLFRYSSRLAGSSWIFDANWVVLR